MCMSWVAAGRPLLLHVKNTRRTRCAYALFDTYKKSYRQEKNKLFLPVVFKV
jgi:hypothetical protein